MRLSVRLQNFNLPPQQALPLAKEMGLDGVQLTIGSGPHAPENLDAEARQRLKETIARLGLVITAAGAGGPEFVYDDPERRPTLLARTREVIRLAADLEIPVCISHIGIIPEDESDPVRAHMVASISAAAQIAADHGVVMAIETGPESPFVLRSFIDEVDSPALKVNYDPANFVIWPALLAKRSDRQYDEREALEAFIPTEGVNLLGPHIVHVHAKDALVEPSGESRETPLGEGWVRWNRFFDLLERYGFDGYIAIERERSGDKVAQIQQAADYLRALERSRK
ncbi:MAG: sugar phosphate isomerase/epimerase family protein [Limnochordia bacterium]|jgi:sugar phosphate isomerase/epimerase